MNGRPRWVRWSRSALIAAGLVVAGYAVLGALDDPFLRDRLDGHLLFLAAVLIGHDLVLLPITIGIGALVGRLVPAGGRTVVRVALVASVAVTAVGLPLALGYGRRPDDPSALPLDYGRGLAVILTAIWLVALAAWAGRRLRHPREPEPDPP